MMQRTLAMMLAVLLSITGILALADDHGVTPHSETQEEEIFWLQGVVTDLEPDAILFTATDGRFVKAKLKETTQMQGDEPVQTGDWIQVAYNGMMSASLRGQIAAMQVICHHINQDALTGTISGVLEDGFLLETEVGEMMIRLQESTLLMVQPQAGLTVRVVLQEDLTPQTAALVIPA